jgi:protein involved in polysaccharide export with SLBB domain
MSVDIKRVGLSLGAVAGALLVIFVLTGCASERVDPAYLALVEQEPGGFEDEVGALGPGDRFALSVHSEDGLSGQYTVSSDGTINYPYVGRINVDGMTCGELERLITEGLADGYLKDPSVSCSILEYNSRRVFVFGEVKSPGSYPYKTHLTIVDVFALAGGFSGRASSNNTKLTRTINGVEVQVRVPMQEIVEGRRKNLRLLPGDIVYVPESAY